MDLKITGKIEMKGAVMKSCLLSAVFSRSHSLGPFEINKGGKDRNNRMNNKVISK